MSGNSITPVDQEMSASNNTGQQQQQPPSRYESQKRRDWNTFGQYLRNHRPPLALARCSGAHVLEFLRYLDQFGKTKVHATPCPFFGHPHPPAPCPCPLRQAWGSLDALIGRLRAAFDENVAGSPDANPFAARAVRLYLREVRDSQSKARGIAYDKKKKRRRRPPPPPPPPSTAPKGLGGGDPMPAPPPHYAVGNLPVRDLNSPTGALLLHHHHLSHHGHVLIALDGSHGGGGVGVDGVDLGVGGGDPPNGSLIPLSVFNQC